MARRNTRTAPSFYSYSAKRSLRQEEVAAYRRIALATVIIVVLLVGGYFLGIPLLAHMGAGSSPVVNKNPLGAADNIPPTAPRLDGLPDVSRVRVIEVTGTSESGATVSVTVNGREQISALADKTGQFKGELSLTGGENTIAATAKDSVGNTSRESKPVTIVYDAMPPKLLITAPSQQHSSTNDSSATITGKTNSAATITINDRQVIVQPDGGFSSTVTLSAGENTITIISSDAAGNQRKATRNITYTAPQSSKSATPG